MDIFSYVYYQFVDWLVKVKIFHFFSLSISLIQYANFIVLFKSLKIHDIVQNYFEPLNIFLEH